MVLHRVVVISKQNEVQQLAHRIAVQALIADDTAEAVDILATVAADLILFDDLAQPADIRSILDSSDNNSRASAVVVGTGAAAPSTFSNLIQAGIIDYLPSAADNEKLQQILNKIRARLDTDSSAGVNGFFADELAATVSMAGRSKSILDTVKMIKLVAGSNCNPVLVTGETGTGKELVARAVHIYRHPKGPFVAINCAALTAALLESELFGHVRGAFTGADKDKTGLLDLAGEGTIFLDEISEMPMELQAKLLRVLQEKTFRKVGGTGDLVCKATIIASSNRDLRREVQARRFRSDLYYRLNICPVTIAPLRRAERKTDIRLLAEYFLRTSTVCPAKAGKITAITEMALEAIEKHSWPGNVRELRNVIERAILLENTDKIGLSSILIEPELDTHIEHHNPYTPAESSIAHRASNNVQDLSLDKAERELIARALQESGWQKTRAAALLGITRATLYAKVKQHNIQRGTYIPKTIQDNLQSLPEPEVVTAA